MKVGQYVLYKNKYYLVVKRRGDLLQLLCPEHKLQVHERNCTATRKAARLVTYRDNHYLVTGKQNIISLTSCKIMKWSETDGNRLEILRRAS